MFPPQQFRDLFCPGIADVEPYNLRRRTFKEASLPKICVLGNNCQPLPSRVVPYLFVVSAPEFYARDVCACRILTGQEFNQSWAKILIEEKLHATELDKRRSRAAANARHARMSSLLRSGKSLRISASLIPPARYSSTSYTVMRVPLRQGLPFRTAGFTVIRSCQFTDA